MSDIDFDELDRAVNGVLSTNDTPAPAPSVPVQETPVEPQPEATTITHVERTQLSPVSSTPKPPVASTAPAARRSSGRFMDVMHPSSDMRSRNPDTQVVVKPEVTAVVQPAAAVDYPESPAWNEPLESPFLPDAKVEKRPLGGGEATSNEASTIADSFDFQGLLDEPEEELLEAPEPQERLEATTMPDPIDFAMANAATPDEPVEVEEIAVETPLEVIEPQPQPVVEAPQAVVEEPVGPTSITPQYKEQASSNQESGAMYDTESYHQAVSAPVKKKSGWFTVVLILLLVVLGAGGGFAVYTYVLPML